MLAILGEVGVGSFKEGRHSGSFGVAQSRSPATFIEGIRLSQPEVLVQVFVGAGLEAINHPSHSRSA